MATSNMAAIAAAGGKDRRRHDMLHWSATLLAFCIWVSGALFGAYILLFFGGTGVSGASARWNESLPGLQDGARPLTTLAIGTRSGDACPPSTAGSAGSMCWWRGWPGLAG
jgi:hypothetical protein